MVDFTFHDTMLLLPTFLGEGIGIIISPIHQRKNPSLAPLQAKEQQRHPSAHLGYRLASWKMLMGTSPFKVIEMERLYNDGTLGSSIHVHESRQRIVWKIFDFSCSACFMIQSHPGAHDMTLWGKAHHCPWRYFASKSCIFHFKTCYHHNNQ